MFNVVARAHMKTAQCNAATEQQPEGWRIVDPPPCLGGSTHRWVLVDNPQYTGARKGMAVGGPRDQTAQYTVQKHPKNGSGAMSIQGKSACHPLSVARRSKRTTTISAAMLTIAVCAHASMVSIRTVVIVISDYRRQTSTEIRCVKT